MFEIESFGPTVRLTMGRSFFGRAFYHCHAYLIDGLLIDTGCPSELGPFRQFVTDHPIDQVAITHYHEDHAGNLPVLNASGIRTYAPATSLDRIRQGIVAQSVRQSLYGKIFWGRSVGGEASALPSVVETDRYRFEVIPVPGHSDDQHLLYERKQGWLFSGDLFIGVRKRYWRREEQPLQVIEALKKVLALDFEVLFCSHLPSLTHGPRLLREKLAYLEEIRDRATRLSGAGRTTSQISKELLGPEGFWTWITGGDFSKRRLIEGVLEMTHPSNSP